MALIIPHTSLGYTPGAWWAEAGYTETNTAHSTARLTFTGTSCVFAFDAAHLTGKTTAEWPLYAWRVRTGAGAWSAWTPHQLNTSRLNGETGPTGLGAGTHEVEVAFTGIVNRGDRFSAAPYNTLRITEFRVDDGATTGVSPRKPLALFYGDSILEGRSVGSASNHRHYETWAHILGDRLGFSLAAAGFGGHGWQAAGSGMGTTDFYEPALTGSWRLHHVGRTRLPLPGARLVLVNHGYNDGASDLAEVQSRAEAWLADIRAQLPNARIAVLVPFAGRQRTPLTDAVTNYQTSSGDANTFLIDLGAAGEGALTNNSHDGVHPNAAGHLALADLIEGHVGPLLLPSRAYFGLVQVKGVRYRDKPVQRVYRSARRRYGEPPSPYLHDWRLAQGSDPQVIEDFGRSPRNAVRGNSAGADGDDFVWDAGFAAFSGSGQQGYGTCDLPGGNADFTLTALLRLGTSPSRKAFTLGAGAANQAVGIGSNTEGDIRLVIYAADQTTTEPFGLGWRVVTFRYQGATRTVTAFVGATQIFQSTLGGDLNLPANPATAFGRPTWSNGEFWGGDVGRVVLDDRALTDAELALLNTRLAESARALGIESADFPPAPVLSAAATSQALYESAGVCLHVPYNDTSYGDTARMLADINDLDVHRVRDGMKANPAQYQLDTFAAIKAQGRKVTMVSGDPTGRDGQFAAGDAALWVASLKAGGDYHGLVDTLESANEWDISNTAVDWPTELAAFNNEFKTALRNEPTLDGLLYYSGALAHDYNYASYTDTVPEGVAVHPYPGGEKPEALSVQEHLDDAIASIGSGKPIIYTETGYNNAQDTAGGNKGVPESVKTHYLPRLIAHNFLVAGVSQTHVYQFMDERPAVAPTTDIEESFGLIGVSGTPAPYTTSKKPSYDAYKRTLALLKDTGNGPLTQPDYTVTVRPSLAQIYPLSRKDGTYLILVWLPNSLYDTTTKTELTDTTGSVTLVFGNAVPVKSYRPSIDGTETDHGTVSSFALQADGKLTVIKVG